MWFRRLEDFKDTHVPELPEVETIARGLEPLLIADRFDRVSVLNPGSLKTDPGDLLDGLPGATVQRVWRRAKLLLLSLEADRHLVFHLKMTGKLFREETSGLEVDKHTRLVFHLASGGSLVFHDVRKFGYCRYLSTADLQSWPFFRSLGPEPLELSGQGFLELLRHRRSRIKALLLNQEVIAGIGNIYADESLHQAGIHPAAIASELEPSRLLRLYGGLQMVLQQALEAKGSSFRDYVDGLGRPGSYQEAFQAYGRAGQPCHTCGCRLRSDRVAGRSSVYCPECQTG